MIGLVYSDESEANSFMKIVTKKKSVFGAYGCLTWFYVLVGAHWELEANRLWLRGDTMKMTWPPLNIRHRPTPSRHDGPKRLVYIRGVFSLSISSRVLLISCILRQAQNGDQHQEEIKRLKELED